MNSKLSMDRICKHCSLGFSIIDSDRTFYKRIGVPDPAFCPSCRQQRRLAFRNERNLYKRKCDLTGQNIISLYSNDKPYHVYSQEIWWSDKWDPLAYGQDFDFNRPFFEQFNELLHKVPKIALSNKNSENSEYVGIGANNKNCYLASPCFQSEDCLYGASIYSCKNTIDSLICEFDEICYGSINCQKCYSVFFSQDCIGCSDLYFSTFCRNCQHCFGCYGLVNTSYHIYNKPVSEAEFTTFLSQFGDSLTVEKIEEFRGESEKIESALPHPAVNQRNAENCVGDNIQDSKNCFYCFDVTRGEDLKYCYRIWDGKDCYDASKTSFGIELCYEVMNAGLTLHSSKFCMVCWTSGFLEYCDHCFNSSYLFGCSGLNRKQYCILNKQYSKKEYETLVPRIVEYMKKTGEYGEFFPIDISPFAYNESTAYDYFPLNKEQVLAMGFQWKDTDREESRTPLIYKVPDFIDKVSNDITNEVLKCTMCGKHFRIIPQELSFYKQYKLPVPHQCYSCRHLQRLRRRNPRNLLKRKCMQCGVEIQTPYLPESGKIIFCGKCYLGVVY